MAEWATASFVPVQQGQESRCEMIDLAEGVCLCDSEFANFAPPPAGVGNGIVSEFRISENLGMSLPAIVVVSVLRPVAYRVKMSAILRRALARETVPNYPMYVGT